MDGRPPLAVSPRRLRPRRPPPGSYALSSYASTGASKKRPPLNRASVSVDSPVRVPPRQLVSSDFGSSPLAERAMTEEQGSLGDVASAVAAASFPPPEAAVGNKSPLFERGRFYDLYSARRNERLKRKQAAMSEEAAAALAQDPAVAVELTKRRVSKKTESVRNSLPADFSASRSSSSLRSSLRSSKEMKKAAALPECSPAGGRRIGTRSLRRL